MQIPRWADQSCRSVATHEADDIRMTKLRQKLQFLDIHCWSVSYISTCKLTFTEMLPELGDGHLPTAKFPNEHTRLSVLTITTLTP